VRLYLHSHISLCDDNFIVTKNNVFPFSLWQSYEYKPQPLWNFSKKILWVSPHSCRFSQLPVPVLPLHMFIPLSQRLVYSSTLKMEAVHSTNIIVNIHQATQGCSLHMNTLLWSIFSHLPMFGNRRKTVYVDRFETLKRFVRRKKDGKKECTLYETIFNIRCITECTQHKREMWSILSYCCSYYEYNITTTVVTTNISTRYHFCFYIQISIEIHGLALRVNCYSASHGISQFLWTPYAMSVFTKVTYPHPKSDGFFQHLHMPYFYGKGKAILVTGHGGPQGCERLSSHIF
jgi:hypothetical protein